MPQPSTSPRNQLIALQRRIVRRLRQEIYDSIESPPAELVAYQREYERSFRGYRKIVSRERLVAALAQADIVLQGDFHTLRESQRAGVRLLRDLLPCRELVLAVEMVNQEYQSYLDGYVAGQIEEDEFLKAIEYERHWGFPWANYRPFFELARECGIPVYAANAPPPAEESTLQFRDGLAAQVIVNAARGHPRALVYAIAGDFHIGRTHLPRRVREFLKDEACGRRLVVLHQNVDAFYWDLARRRLEHQAEVLEVAPDEFCLMNSTPVAKYQSYFHWELGQDELLEGAGCLGAGRANALVPEEVRRLIQTITEFLGIESSSLDDFTVYTSSDLDFLEHLRRRKIFREREYREIKRQLLNHESYFIAPANIIYLASLSVDHAAEEATHYINNKLAGYLDYPLPARVDFYYRVIKEALGFFGSKIVNHLRFHYGEAEFRAICRQYRGRPVQESVAFVLAIARFVLQHLEAEKQHLSLGRPLRLRAIYQQEVDLHLGITHSLGYILGDKLYKGLLRGTIDRGELRALFCRTLDGENEAEELYFELVSQLDQAVPRKRRA